MKVYSPSDVAKLLNIKPATLRKYSIMLEEHGYNIGRNSQNHRYYQDKDIITLRSVMTGTKSGITLEESIKNVVNVGEDNTYTNATNNGVQAYESDISELKELVNNQTEVIKEFSKRLDQQDEYINNSLKERDAALVESIKDLLETKKELAAAEEKGGWFSRFFNRR